MTTEQRLGEPVGRTNVGGMASTPVVAVEGHLEPMAALREMYRNGVHHLAVFSGEMPPGLVSAVDLLFALAGRLPGEAVQVDGLCRRPAPSVETDVSAAAAAHRMIEAGSDALLVTAGGEVRGVLTAMDFVRVAGGSAAASAADEAQSDAG